MNLSGFDRVRWFIYFEVLGKTCRDEPKTIDEIYVQAVKEGSKIGIDIEYTKLLEILKEFENRNIVKIFKINGKTYIDLTEKARYYLLTYAAALSNL